MPGYQAHLCAGAAAAGAGLVICWSLDFYRLEPMVMAALVAISTLSALFPDTDTCSVGRRFFYLLILGMDLVLIVNEQYKWAALLGLLALLPALSHHRGWTHTWWAALLAPSPIIILPAMFMATGLEESAPFYLAALVGYVSHIFLDKVVSTGKKSFPPQGK